jgi:hypothetical protein
MPATVTLTVTRGQLQGQTFVFAERTTCIVGRADDCSPRLPNDRDHQTISRYHCLLDIDPPDIRVRDFGSLNGTFVNGRKIGQREKGMSPQEAAQVTATEHDLKDGDQIELGNTVFRVSIAAPPESEPSWATVSRAQPAACACCGRDVSSEMGEHRHGSFVCASCKADPLQVLEGLLGQADSGRRDLEAIRGYEVLRELGRGGMGAVYLARKAGTGEDVALKVMLPRVAADAQAREMFLRETENTRSLKHPHVVELRDAGCSAGTFFFTLEYCDGGSVADLMKQRGGPLAIDEAVAIALQCLAGLDYAHNVELDNVKRADGSVGRGRGLVHRDLKPQNLFLSGQGSARRAKVGDFGLAKAFDQAGLSGQTRTGTAAGTPVFMPRQQVINFKYSRPEVDVWAMAASLYFMLTGQFVRDFIAGKDPWQLVLQNAAVPIRQRAPSIPAKLAEVIDLALVDKPQIHFKTAADLRQALEGAC